MAVDEIDEAFADAVDRRDVELHRPGAHRDSPGAEVERAAEGEVGRAIRDLVQLMTINRHKCAVCESLGEFAVLRRLRATLFLRDRLEGGGQVQKCGQGG